MQKITIEKEYITLAQLLKLCDFVSSGGEAKIACQELSIFVNGEEEHRRGKKLYRGDDIIIENESFVIK